jgi:hypothetical protein
MQIFIKEALIILQMGSPIAQNPGTMAGALAFSVRAALETIA